MWATVCAGYGVAGFTPPLLTTISGIEEISSAQRTFTYTFNQTGVYEYYCIPHEIVGMVGTVRVRRAGDVDFSGCIDDADLLRVLFAFGQTGARYEDLNYDRVVDDADLLIVLFNFGSGC
jgi:hypothetical protein